jgi:hypothetical protein
MPEPVVPESELARVPEEYRARVWPLLREQCETLRAFGARYARSWLVQHRYAARLPELDVSPGALNENARALALDAFIAIYYGRHLLPKGADPKAFMISTINSLGANRLRGHENWLRGYADTDGSSARSAFAGAGTATVDEESELSNGKRKPRDRAIDMRNAAALKATLPAGRGFEAKLVDMIAVHGLHDRKRLAKSMNAPIEKIRKSLNWLAEHVKTIHPAKAACIEEGDKYAVPAHTIEDAPRMKKDRSLP